MRESWSIADGLPVNSVGVVLQDRRGYLWAATFDGLVRFDGNRFTVFNSANSEGLPSDRIVNLEETRDGALWIITESGHLLHFAHERFTLIDSSRGLASASLAMYEDRDGTLLIGTEQGIGAIRNGRFVAMAAETVRAAVRSILRDREGSLWIGTKGAGIFEIDARGARRRQVPRALEVADVYLLAQDDRGSVWVGSTIGVARFALGSAQPDPAIVSLPGVDGIFPVPGADRILVHSTNGLFEVAPGKPMRTVDPGRSEFVIGPPVAVRGRDSVWHAMGDALLLNGRVVHKLEIPGTSSQVQITKILFDRENGIWLTTILHGLHRLRLTPFTVYGEREGLRALNAYVVARDSSDAIWVRSLADGISRVAPDRRSVRHFDARSGVPGRLAALLALDRDSMLIAAPGEVLTCTTRELRCTRDSSTLFADFGAFAFHRMRTGRILAGTATGVLERVEGSWRVFAGWTVRRPARVFVEESSGVLWIGTNGNGLVRCHQARCRAMTEHDGLPSNNIRSLLLDADGWLWIGTEGRGLARLDTRRWPETNPAHRPSITHFATNDGLHDAVVHQILDDGLGRYWMNSNRGIFWVRRSELMAFAEGRLERVHSTVYTERDGLRNREGNGGYQPAGVASADGTLWFPTQAGVVAVDPRRVGSDRLAPSTAIEQVASRTRRLVADTALRLDPTERDLEITYTALSFVESQNVRFRYRLDPYDADWVDAAKRRTAFYTRVPPGRYAFRVAASYGGDRWSATESVVTMELLPRFYETNLARLIFIVAIAATMALLIRGRLIASRVREAELAALVQQRTADLRRNEDELATQNAKLAGLNQMRSQLFANLSHEFRTPLTLILGPLRSLIDGRHGEPTSGMREQLELMLRNGQRLLRLINQILDLARMQGGALSIVRQPVEMLYFTRALTIAFRPLAERRGLTIAFHTALSELTMLADAVQLEKVLFNLLSNAAKFTESGGHIDVVVNRDDDTIAITVRDDGPGIAQSDLPHVFERFYQADNSATRRYEGTGIGLALAKELVELHGGTISVVSAVGEGSAFTIRLPIVHAEAATSAPSRVAGDAEELLSAELSGASPDGHRASAHGDADEEEQDRTTVLIVDDNDDIRRYVRSVLSPSYRVLEAADGEEGLALARQSLPDLIVADVMMPRLDGLAMGRALKGDPMTDTIPVILLTARASSAAQIAGLQAGADAYMVKPFDPDVLLASVHGLLAQRRRLRERLRAGEEPIPPSPIAPLSAPSELDLRLRPLVEARLLDPDFSPEILADNAGLSYHQLYRRLRDELSTTPSHYIRGVRADRAADLLRAGSGSVTEIAYAVGFESLSYFRRAFREQYGMTPSEFLEAAPRS